VPMPVYVMALFLMIGALLLTLVLNGMNLLQINSSWQPLVTGLIILLAVWIDTRTRRIGE
jgi:ribose transport system permease protein